MAKVMRSFGKFVGKTVAPSLMIQHHRHAERSLRLQSAMEYLMTYGWAILVIAVVLASLYQLGIFNTSNSASRAQPGSCKVFRPNGPGTTAFINLVGVCTGQLPQFVASFASSSSYITIKNSVSLTATNTLTVAAWVYGNSWYSGHSIVLTKTGSLGNKGYGISVYNSGVRFYAGGKQEATGYILNTGVWYQIVGTYDKSLASNNIQVYVNGVFVGGNTQTGGIVDDGSDIVTTEYSGTYNGFISNVQIYNASLDSSAIQSLYVEGIGGAPVSPQYLVGWWPLNGDAKDYSGNNNNGAATSVSYTGSWTSGYLGR